MEYLHHEARLNNNLSANLFLKAYGGGFDIQFQLNNISAGQNNIFPTFELSSVPTISMAFNFRGKKETTTILFDNSIPFFGFVNNNLAVESAIISIKPGEVSPFLSYFCLVRPDKWQRMKEAADKDGVVELLIYTTFSFNLSESIMSRKPLLWNPVTTFSISKGQLEQFISVWSSSRNLTTSLSVPENLPSDILMDMIEASKCIDVEASRGSVVLLRRAIQQAAIISGASPNKNLQDQIDELQSKKILSKDVSNLAHGLRFMGNFGAHPDNDLLKDITLEDAKLGMGVTLKILKQLFPK